LGTRIVDKKFLESFEMWCWKRIDWISWTDPVKDEEVLHRVKEENNILHTIKGRNTNWIVYILRRNCLLKRVSIEVTGRRRRRLKQILDKLKETRGYWKLKEDVADRILWRTHFERDCGPVVGHTAD
jgi:hypothetical protein